MPVDLDDPELADLLRPSVTVVTEWWDGVAWRPGVPRPGPMRRTEVPLDEARVAAWMRQYVEPLAIAPGEGRDASREQHLAAAKDLVFARGPRAIDGVLAARDYVRRFR